LSALEMTVRRHPLRAGTHPGPGIVTRLPGPMQATRPDGRSRLACRQDAFALTLPDFGGIIT